jgi:hypothetical protein
MLPVLLYITRFHWAFQGISGSYRKIIGFWDSDLGGFPKKFLPITQPVGAQTSPDTRTWVVMPDGAYVRQNAKNTTAGPSTRYARSG